MFNKYLLAALVGVVLVGLVGPAQGEPVLNYWGHAATPVSNYWHNDSNWELGIPTTGHRACIRSDRGYEEHLTVQSGNTAVCDWIKLGKVSEDEVGDPPPRPDVSLTVEAGGKLCYATGAPIGQEAYGKFQVGVFYNATVHNYGTITGWENWPYYENLPFPNAAFYPAIMVGYKYDARLPDGGKGYMFCHDGSLSVAGLTNVSDRSGTQGWLEIQEGASFECNFEMNIGNASILGTSSAYGEVNLLGGTLDISDHWNEPEDKLNCGLKIGKAGASGGTGVLNLESGVFYIEGNLAVVKGTVSIGKDVDATANSDYLIRPASYVDVWGNTVTGQHGDANDFLTTVEIDIDPQSGVVTNSTVVVNGDTHMDGHLYIENSGDRPKECDQFTLFDGDAGQTHDGSFLTVTTNLTCWGDPGYAVAPVNGDWIAEFTGLTVGDINGDHKVSIGDLAVIAGGWDQPVLPGPDPLPDLNCDGFIGIGDLSMLAGTWGWELDHPCVLIPEPATLSLLALGGLAVIRRRRS